MVTIWAYVQKYKTSSRWQQTNSPPTLTLTAKARTQAASRGLTVQDAADVYYHGQEVKPNMMVRDYNGYSIGLYYFLDKRTKCFHTECAESPLQDISEA